MAKSNELAMTRPVPAPEPATRRVLFITLDFPPSRNIGAHACEQMARYLPDYGWDPVVLTLPRRDIESADPNYRREFPGTVVHTRMFPHPISIYRRLKRSSNGNGNGAGIGTEKSEKRLRRWLLSMLQMPDIYTGWLVPATIAGLTAIRRDNITHIFSSAPYWTNHLVGLVLARLTGLPWTIHYRDPWNQVPQAKAVSHVSHTFEKWLERMVITRADRVVCVTEPHMQLLRELFPNLPRQKFITIPNGYDEAEWSEVPRLPLPAPRSFTISYTGGFAMGTRSPRPLFRALRQLIDAGELEPNELRVELCGHCDVAEGMRVSDMTAMYGLDPFVEVTPPASRPETLRRMARADLLLLLAEGWTLQIPGKTYEYLRAGRPILALTSDGALADLLRRTGGASIAEPDDEVAICSAIRDAYVAWKMGRTLPAAASALVAGFNRQVLAGRFAELFGLGRGTA